MAPICCMQCYMLLNLYCIVYLQTLRVWADEFELESSTGCSNDNVTVFDGPSTTSPPLGAFCGTTMGSTSSTSDVVLVQFMTNMEVNKKGFQLRWEIVCKSHDAFLPFFKCYTIIPKSYTSTTSCCGYSTIDINYNISMHVTSTNNNSRMDNN